EAVLKQVAEGALHYLDRALPPYNEDRRQADLNVTRLELKRGDVTYVLSREKKDKAEWKFEKPDSLKGRTPDKGGVAAILNALNSRGGAGGEEEGRGNTNQREYTPKAPPLRAVVTVTRDKEKPKDYEYAFGNDTTKDGPDRFGRQRLPDGKPGMI